MCDRLFADLHKPNVDLYNVSVTSQMCERLEAFGSCFDKLSFDNGPSYRKTLRQNLKNDIVMPTAMDFRKF